MVNLKIDITKLEFVKSIKYLGVVIEGKLKFGGHLDYLHKKISEKK